jgi:hypothetical protein
MAIERERWEVRAEGGVGSLWFGKSSTEVAKALLVSEPEARIGGPYEQEDFPSGVKAFYAAGNLVCVALDAVTGPQVLRAGFPLAGRDPARAPNSCWTMLQSVGTQCSTPLTIHLP